MSLLILPGDPLFDLTLGACLPNNWAEVASQSNGDFALVARADSGILEAVAGAALDEYVFGGEWDERLAQIEDE